MTNKTTDMTNAKIAQILTHFHLADGSLDYDQAAAEIMKLMQGWVSVEDALPELPKPYYDKHTGHMMRRASIRVLVYGGEDVYEESADEDGFHTKCITHWQYLPTPPLTPKSTDQ